MAKIKTVGFYDRGTGQHQSNTVFHWGGCSPTVTTAGTTASQQIKVLKRWRRKSILSAASERTKDRIVTDTEL